MTAFSDFPAPVDHPLHPGAESFADRRTLVYGNGISGLEVASDLAFSAPVVSAFRKPQDGPTSRGLGGTWLGQDAWTRGPTTSMS